jgi:predicted dehydrogenase/UDP-N-acetylglucosamine transferase subunit ALG13
MIFVTVGTNETPFDRLVEAAAALPGEEDLLIQHGASQVEHGRGDWRDYLSFEEMEAAIRSARIVVTHAGVGSILLALKHGRHPLVMPRRGARGEAVDDHQLGLAQRLEEKGVVTVVETEAALYAAIAAAGAAVPLRPATALRAAEAGGLAQELRAYLAAQVGAPAPLPAPEPVAVPAAPIAPVTAMAAMAPAADAPVRMAAVGLGYWGPNLVRAWATLPETRLDWICDLDEASLARTGAQFPDARRTRRYEDVLEDPEVEAVALATSVPTHAALALRALEAGKHVFVEKPLATSAEDARRLVTEARRRDRKLLVGHLLVHHPGVAKLSELLTSGELGTTQYIYTNRVNLGRIRADENALWSLGAHDVSVLLHLVGRAPDVVSAQGHCFIRPGIEDVVFCLLRFGEDVIAHMHMSWLDPHKERKVTVVGSDKMAVFDDMKPDAKVTVYDKGVTINHDSEPGHETWRPASYGEYAQLRFGDTSIPRISSEEPLRIQARHFARCVRGLEVPRAGGEQGVAVVEVLEALQRSLDAGGAPVTLGATPPLELRAAA